MRYPSRYLPQSSSNPTCRSQTPTQPDTDPVRTHWIPHRCPKAVVIGCGGGGGSIRALDNIFEFTGVTDHDWRALECTRASGMTTNALFKRTCPGDTEYGSWVKSLKPGVIIGNTSTRANELEGGTARHSRSSYHHGSTPSSPPKPTS